LNEFEQLIRAAADRHASDLHISVGRPPSCRIDGTITPLAEAILKPPDIESIAYGIMNDVQITRLREDGEVDFAYSIINIGRYRVNVFRQRGTLALVARILNLHIPRPEELGLPRALVEMAHKRRGLVLVTGATGSGKSTTLASLINVINERYNHHIITLEDPVEYLHQHKKSIVNQREMGSDSKSFANALRAALRQDPDVILVGEMRDLETIATAITAAETGHLVFSTLHTIGAANTIDRIIDIFPAYQQQQIRTQLADVLECVVSQQLLQRRDGKGRIAAIELMLKTPAIQAHIREAKTFQIPSVLQTNKSKGMQTMDDAIFDLLAGMDVTRDIALSYCQDLQAFTKKLQTTM
jgi:twitching motility protein PilT